jgi:hypothetical protein
MIARSSAEEQEDGQRVRANRQLAFGAVLLVLGIVIAAATYGNASTPSGTYIIAYGPDHRGRHQLRPRPLGHDRLTTAASG